jgi:hypothetical protein
MMQIAKKRPNTKPEKLNISEIEQSVFVRRRERERKRKCGRQICIYFRN